MFDRVVAAIQALLGSEEIANIEERRGNLRIPADLALVGRVGESTYPMRLIDVGIAGLRVESTSELPVPGHIQLTLAEPASGVPVECQIRWCREVSGKYHSGISFEDPEIGSRETWVRPLLDELGLSRQLRRQKRQYLRLVRSATRIALLRADGEELPGEARLVDLSHGGARVQLATRLPDGERVRLCLYPVTHLPALELAAVIIASTHDEENEIYSHRLVFDLERASTQEALDRYLTLNS